MYVVADLKSRPLARPTWTTRALSHIAEAAGCSCPAKRAQWATEDTGAGIDSSWNVRPPDDAVGGRWRYKDDPLEWIQASGEENGASAARRSTAFRWTWRNYPAWLFALDGPCMGSWSAREAPLVALLVSASLDEGEWQTAASVRFRAHDARRRSRVARGPASLAPVHTLRTEVLFSRLRGLKPSSLAMRTSAGVSRQRRAASAQSRSVAALLDIRATHLLTPLNT
jgi:hypothetical protein